MQGKPLLEHLFLSCKGIGAKQLQKHQSKISSGGESGQSRSRVIVCVQLVTHQVTNVAAFSMPRHQHLPLNSVKEY